MSKEIFLDAPNVGKLEKQYLNEAIDKSYVSSIGPFVQKFEERFARYLRIKKAVATQSGTAALHMALNELGVGPEDEVIVPALTFIATVNPIVYLAAKPVFVDVDIQTWTIDPEEIERSITKKTKAIIPVHLYGNPCNMEAILKIAEKNRICLIEDATESLGAKYNGKYTGTLGDFGCFSFNGNKIITTGGGGMVVGNDVERLGHIKFLVNQARDGSEGCYHSEVGFNYRMTNIEAALGLAQMERLKEFLAKKREINNIYKQGLKDLKHVRFQAEFAATESSCWISCLVFESKIDIAALQKKLQARGIPTRRIFRPCVEFPPYELYKRGTYPNSYEIYNQGLCLPSSTLNSEQGIHFVCKTIKESL